MRFKIVFARTILISDWARNFNAYVELFLKTCQVLSNKLGVLNLTDTFNAGLSRIHRPFY